MKSILYTSFIFSLIMLMSLEGQSKSVNSLENHHICTKLINYDEDKVIPKTKMEKYEVKYWCMKIPPICTKHKYKVITVNETITLTKSKIVSDCCRGYKNENKTCVPVCTLGCGHGECVEPEVCLCNEGWKGHNCSEECSFDTYGPDCTKKCICENGGWCDKETGHCYCPEGYTGDHCELDCPLGWYGLNCEQQCQCQNDALCSVANGYCYCQPGYYGNYCEHKCEPGFHGYDCSNICLCEKDTTEICHHEDGRCICKPGYTGAFCQNTCSNMTYGIGCTKHCDCKNAQFCEPIHGKCICDIGWIGEKCSEKCPEGYFGEGCKYQCKYSCNSVKAVCNHVTGICECSPGYYGNNCEMTCPENIWGSNCSNICNCSVSEICDFKTGDCYCKPGRVGKACSTPCSPNFWGINCSKTCSCLENEDCNAEDGKCSCKVGWVGENCSTPCSRGQYGLDCKYRCPCPIGDTCHKNNGTCIITVKTSGFNTLHIIAAVVITTLLVGTAIYFHLKTPSTLRKFYCCNRSSSNQDLRMSRESIGVHFQNPLYCNAKFPTAETTTADGIQYERSVSFVDIISSIRASMKEKASSCQSGLDTEASLKRASKVSNLSASNAPATSDKERANPFSITDELDGDYTPENLKDFNIARNIDFESGEKCTDSTKNN